LNSANTAHPVVKQCHSWLKTSRCQHLDTCAYFHFGKDCYNFFCFAQCNKGRACTYQHRDVLLEPNIKTKNATSQMGNQRGGGNNFKRGQNNQNANRVNRNVLPRSMLERERNQQAGSKQNDRERPRNNRPLERSRDISRRTATISSVLHSATKADHVPTSTATSYSSRTSKRRMPHPRWATNEGEEITLNEGDKTTTRILIE